MKQLRKHPLFLLAIALALPLGVTFLFYDFYDDNDLVCHTQISMADDGDLLCFLRKNSVALVSADQSLQLSHKIPIETKSFRSNDPVSIDKTSSILRC